MAQKTIHLDYDEALGLLNKAVQEKGKDYVYEEPDDSISCVYFKDGAPSCIVGHVLAAKGVTQQDLQDYNTLSVVRLLGGSPRTAHFRLDVDERTQRLLSGAQDAQDSGTPWGDAVESGIEYSEEEDAD